jgi:copper(I)-binding protein
VNVKKKVFSIWSVLLVLLVSITVLVPGCDGEGETGTIDVKATLDGSAWSGAVQYTLTGPGAAAPTIINGTSVPTTHRNAEPGSWTCAYVSGGASVFVNITPAATQSLTAGATITFTLNFVTTGTGGLDHFKCYWFHHPAYTPQPAYYVGETVDLEDQFGSVEARVEYAEYFCNPAKKTYDGEVTEIKNDDDHLMLYGIATPTTQKWVVDVNNQFGEQTLHVSGPVKLAVPTQKEGHDFPEDLDHYLLYETTDPNLNIVVQLEDQFNLEPDVTVLRPVYFANPVQKTTQDGDTFLITNDQAHIVFYEIIEEETFQTDVDATNQFHTVTVSMPQSARYINMLAVPSQKISYGPPPALDHFKFYEIVDGPYVGDVMQQVEDQFYTGIDEVQVWYPRYFGNPVAKTYAGTTTPIGDEDHHLMLYDITTRTTQTWRVDVDNQFGEQSLTVTGPVMLAVPTIKEEHDPPRWLDHYLLYKVIEGEDVQKVVDLEDQWHKESDVEVHRPVYFANPAGKVPPNIDWSPGMPLTLHNTEDHMVLYEIVGETFQKDVRIHNQLHEQQQTISVEEPTLLAVPSEKVSFEEGEPEPMLDHFLCYWIPEALPLQAYVYLEDQFCTVEGTVDWHWWFCNPTEKRYEVVTPVSYPDHHLTVYGIHTIEEPQHWFVNVNNQFGTQSLTVYGPVALAVPTQKLEPGGHSPPEGLDHYMLYEVVEGPYFEDVVVGLDDQFHDIAEGEVIAARYFANPVQKTDETGLVTEIVNDQTHQVFYEIIAGQYYYQGIIVANQFGEQTFDVADAILLTVPSQKISWDWLQD